MSAGDAWPLVLRGGLVAHERAPAGRPEPLDIAIGPDGRIRHLSPALPVRAEEEWHLQGRLVMPGMVDVHQHLDKSRTARVCQNPLGTLAGAVAGFRAYARTASSEDIVRRAARTAEACLRRGTVAVRSHADVTPDWGLRGVRALVELRERLGQRLRLQVVALVVSADGIGTAEALDLLEAALAEGADVVGGAPAFAAEPIEYLDMLFEVAVRRDRPLDLHIDETLTPTHRHIEYVARKTQALGLGGRVVAGHCCSLAALAREDAAPIIDAVARAGLGVVALPASNLFLQGREAPGSPPRGLTRVAELLEAGVRVAYGSDNIQDPFTPTGTGDLLEVGRWTLLSGQLSAVQASQLVAMGTTIPAAMMGFAQDYGIREGAYADLLIVDADDPEDAIHSGPVERTVLVRGRPVAGPSLRTVNG